jgi:HSP20 family molecular chaperone IbpA
MRGSICRFAKLAEEEGMGTPDKIIRAFQICSSSTRFHGRPPSSRIFSAPPAKEAVRGVTGRCDARHTVGVFPAERLIVVKRRTVFRKQAVKSRESAERHGGETRPRIAVMDAEEQSRRIRRAIARRAYEIYESRGFAQGHEEEHWRQAERELVRRPCCGVMSEGDTIWVGMDAASFAEGTMELWVAPRMLTICGKPREDRIGVKAGTRAPSAREEMIFRMIDLPAEIAPTEVTARFRGHFLEIKLQKTVAQTERKFRAAAA